jgi:hypothetical protein
LEIKIVTIITTLTIDYHANLSVLGGLNTLYFYQLSI